MPRGWLQYLRGQTTTQTSCKASTTGEHTQGAGAGKDRGKEDKAGAWGRVEASGRDQGATDLVAATAHPKPGQEGRVQDIGSALCTQYLFSHLEGA